MAPGHFESQAAPDGHLASQPQWTLEEELLCCWLHFRSKESNRVHRAGQDHSVQHMPQGCP